MKTNIRYVLLLLGAALFVSGCRCGQDTVSSEDTVVKPCLENGFSRPMRDVIEDVAEMFGTEIHYARSAVPEDMMLRAADFKIFPWSIEETLDNIVSDTPLSWRKREEGDYSVFTSETSITHTRLSPERGKELLDYLSSRYESLEEWEARKDTLRSEFRKALGLSVLPDVPRGTPIVCNRRVLGDIYTENMAIEFLPGIYCTGSVYHPVNFSEGACPAILHPQGHGNEGRRREQAQNLCQMLAKMGCVVYAYDMFAWHSGDQSIQYGDDVKNHRHAITQNMQLLMGIRALDYMCSLPEVDKSRICVTGASGGGSQSMFLTAYDDRITMSIPVVMTSCYFNGGCACESGSGVHLICGRTCNTEIAALCAPRPMLLVSDGNDWTACCPEFDMPYMKKIYGFYGREDFVENAHFPDEFHDYGISKRLAVYDFICRNWDLDASKVKNAAGEFDESANCVLESDEALSVWGLNGERLPSNAVRTIPEVEKAWNRRNPR